LSLKVGMLIAAIAGTVVYGYGWLFVMTAQPVDQLHAVMDLAGRVASVSWIISANIALRERSRKRDQAAEIISLVR
jgi:hypothetical protein